MNIYFRVPEGAREKNYHHLHQRSNFNSKWLLCLSRMNFQDPSLPFSQEKWEEQVPKSTLNNLESVGSQQRNSSSRRDYGFFVPSYIIVRAVDFLQNDSALLRIQVGKEKKKISGLKVNFYCALSLTSQFVIL